MARFFSAVTVSVAWRAVRSCIGLAPCRDMPNAIRIIGTAASPIMSIGSKMKLGITNQPTCAEITDTTMPSTEAMSIGWWNGCFSTSLTDTRPVVAMSSTVSPTGVNSACCMTRIGATSAGSPRM